MKMQKSLRYKTKRAVAGWLFILPWIIGFLVFFIRPLLATLRYSFSMVSPGDMSVQDIPGGALAPFTHYIEAFTRDPNYVWYFKEAIKSMLYSLPLVIVFSMFIANILVKKFVGRTFMRAIFFLPVIITTGVIINLIRTGLTSVQMGSKEMTGGNMFDPVMLTSLLLDSGLPRTVVDFISAAVGNIVDLVWVSGIQILIFMAGILSIPVTYYEVAAVEGSTAWENFWKITFPLIIPHILINAVYTLVDSLSSYDNALIRYINDTMFRNLKFDKGSALAWIYFVVVLLLIGIVLAVVLLLTRQLGDTQSTGKRRKR